MYGKTLYFFIFTMSTSYLFYLNVSTFTSGTIVRHVPVQNEVHYTIPNIASTLFYTDFDDAAKYISVIRIQIA